MLPYFKCQDISLYKMFTKCITCLIIKEQAENPIRASCTSTAAIKRPAEFCNSLLVTVFVSWEWIQCWLSSWSQ